MILRSFRCFIDNAYTALCGIIAPVLVVLMVVGIVFIQAFQLMPQWQAYDDVYKGRYNLNGTDFLREMPSRHC